MSDPRPFSNGSEAEHFRWNNCRRCVYYNTPGPDEDFYCAGGDLIPCPIEELLAYAAIDRSFWPGWALEGDGVHITGCKAFKEDDRIADAPTLKEQRDDLLEALEGMVEAWDRRFEDDPFCQPDSTQREIAGEAIANAKGES